MHAPPSSSRMIPNKSSSTSTVPRYTSIPLHTPRDVPSDPGSIILTILETHARRGPRALEFPVAAVIKALNILTLVIVYIIYLRISRG